ncbi:hypothetical protein Q1695_007785 [Nippostrongylus brasiliensis]|nr:hypothetical protein Q1695_007785 [Nippostrongylus brasiliensis]
MQRVSTAPSSLLIQSHRLLQKPSQHVRAATPTKSRRLSSVDVPIIVPQPASQPQKLQQSKKSNTTEVIGKQKAAVPAKASSGKVALKTSTDAENSMTASTDEKEAPSPSVQPTASENDLRIDVSESANTSKTSSSLLTPPSEDDQDSKPSPAQSSCGALPRKRKSNGFRKTEECVRKSGRITRTCDASAVDFVDNYVDSKRLKQPRIVQAPKGGVRIPNVMPKNKGAKEKDKLSIDMVGPRTRSSLVELISPLGGTRRRNTHVELSAKIGPDHQASFEPFYACDFTAPSISRVDYEDREREELVWTSEPSGSSSYTVEDLDEAWTAIRSQYGGTIGIDAMLYSLMKNNYNIDAMLTNIEQEQWENLTQPFEEPNIAQQKEFERILRDVKGKNFAAIQDKFMRQYYLGEITQYYYQSKRRSCLNERYTRCLCRDRLTSAVAVKVPRYECTNCTKYLWEGKHRPPKYCAVCQLFYKRNGCHRNVISKLFEHEERIVRRWVELEKDNKRCMSSTEIPTHPAKKKLKNEQIMELTQKFKPTTNPRCSLLTEYGNVASRVALEGFKDDEILKIIRAFKKMGKKFVEVSNAVGNRSPQEISLFYKRYRLQYNLDALFESHRKALLPPIISTSTSRSSHPENGSASPTPEPVSRRKRAGSDPSYPEGEVVPAKTTRVTRQTAASGSREPAEKELNGRLSPRSVSVGVGGK